MCDGLWIECRGKAAEMGRVGRTPKSKAGRGEVVKRLGRAEKVAAHGHCLVLEAASG